MGKFGVSQAKEKKLLEKMRRYKIREKDLKENFISAAKKGGTKTNKTSSGVYLKHLPTGTEVKCSSSRSRPVNRFLARRRLADKIENAVEGRKSRLQKKIEKIRRQKRKRSKRAKEKILREKKINAEKKSLRGKVKYDENKT